MKLQRTTSVNVDFVELVRFLDGDLAIRDGEDHAFYNQFNRISELKHVIVAYLNDRPVGCGAIKHHGATTMEIKRMYTRTVHRGQGVASSILLELEKWALELNYKACLLETGINQPEAIGLYQKLGYEKIPNYDQYRDVVGSVCFQKKLV